MNYELYKQNATGTVFKVELFPTMKKDFQKNKFHLIYELESDNWVASSYMSIGNSFEQFKESHTKIEKDDNMNEIDINKFKDELEIRLDNDNVHDHTEKYDYMEAVRHTLTFLKVDDPSLNKMLKDMNEKINREYEAEYGI